MKGIGMLFKAVASTTFAVVLAYVFFFGGQDLIRRPPATPAPPPAWSAAPGTAQAPSPGVVDGRPDFAAMVDATRPAVVNISTTQAGHGGRGAPLADPLREFLERYFGEQLPREEPRRSLGSGLIVEPDGYVLTNNHVIENAQTIMVRLADEEEFEARVVGRDPRTDLALLKIQGRREFPVARLGDSDSLRVGEWVLAIGNPFGLEQTVTAGIVSAKGRVIGAGPYDDFIQTDAAINPGNSGGPLFNTRGDVVGVNTAIFSQTGGSVGIGFAIPINLAKELIPQLKAKGRVARAWLGVGIGPVTAELAKKLGRAGRDGALVAEVVPNGPAARAGVRPGDLVVAFRGKPIRRADELPRLTAKAPVGSDVELSLWRDGKEQAVTVRLGELPERPQG
jgi:serine protease Do